MIANKDHYEIRQATPGLTAGLAFIININKFEGTEEEREGSKKDVDNLKDMFEYLNFDVEVQENLRRNGIQKALIDFAEKLENNPVDICAVCVMSHGKRDQVLGSDERFLDIEQDILYRFSNENCRSMIGKPKLFIFQSCRGDKKDTGLRSGASPGSSVTEGPKNIASVLEDAIIAYSTIPNYVAWRNIKDGSYFVNILCKVFKEHAHEKEIQDLFKIVTRMMKEVNVVDDDLGAYRTTPEVCYRIDKDVYFHPKICESTSVTEENEKQGPNAEESSNKLTAPKSCCIML